MEMCEFYVVKESGSIWLFLQNDSGSNESSPHPQIGSGFILLRTSAVRDSYERGNEPWGSQLAQQSLAFQEVSILLYSV